MRPNRLLADRFCIDDPEQDLLGRGGMGTVYCATDTLTGQLVAVKTLDPNVVARDPEILERFVGEGEALRQLNRPNIVRMVAAVEEQGRHYLVMEYVPASSQRTKDHSASLAERIESQLPPDVVASAKERGRARDLDATVGELLIELGE